MRKCVKCGFEKELQDFRKNGKWFKHTCKECLNAPLRTGKEHTGRFKKGDKSSERTQFKSGQTPHNKGKKLSPEEIEKMKECFKKRKMPKRGGLSRNSHKYKEWKRLVFERDFEKCMRCESQERLDAHHIVAWVDNEDLRFDVKNGETLCRCCHMYHEYLERQKKGISTEFKKGKSPINKGKLHSEEHKRKLREAWIKRKQRALDGTTNS